jgi:hypothetical protein
MTAKQLAQKIKAANGDDQKINDAKQKFVDEGGAAGVQEGGKVFSDVSGDTVFVTDGGKVFGGKVF